MGGRSEKKDELKCLSHVPCVAWLQPSHDTPIYFARRAAFQSGPGAHWEGSAGLLPVPAWPTCVRGRGEAPASPTTVVLASSTCSGRSAPCGWKSWMNGRELRPCPRCPSSRSGTRTSQEPPGQTPGRTHKHESRVEVVTHLT